MVRILAFLMSMVVLTGGAATAADYLLQFGDRVEITVLEDASLNRQALIRPDGKISMPLAGTITAAGLTPEQLQGAIRKGLSRDFVGTPTVTVALVGVAPETPTGPDEPEIPPSVYVVGQVANPGRIAMDAPMTLLQALAISGGPGVFAATSRIQLRRTVDGADTLMLFDYAQIEDGTGLPAPVELVDGDVIVVPERDLFE